MIIEGWFFELLWWDKNELTEVGELLKNVDTKYGKNVIKDYSKRLTNKFGKKYTPSLLYKIKQFYIIIEKVPTMSGKLTWSHWYEVLSFDDIKKIEYYVNQCEVYNIDVRKLRNKIKSNEYERLDEETKNKLKNKEELKSIRFSKELGSNNKYKWLQWNIWKNTAKVNTWGHSNIFKRIR